MASDFVPIASGMLATLRARHTSGKLVFNTIHARGPTTLPTITDVTLFANTVVAWIASDYKALYSQSYTCIDVTARSIATEPSPVAVTASGQVGSQNGDEQPASTTMVSTLLTGLTGLSHRGRFFVWPADETKMTNGLFTAAYASATLVALTNLMGALGSAGIPWVIASYRHLTLFDITDNRPSIIPAHLRSRRVDKGI